MVSRPVASVVLNKRRLDRLIGEAPGQLRNVIKVSAFNIERRAKETPPPIDTGATTNSIHVVINDGSGDYQAAAAAARGARPGVKLNPENPPPGNDGLSARIGPSTEYALPLELGSRFMPARPFMVPALEAERGPFTAAVGEIFKKAGRA